jgi:hypothetical protein
MLSFNLSVSGIAFKNKRKVQLGIRHSKPLLSAAFVDTVFHVNAEFVD